MNFKKIIIWTIIIAMLLTVGCTKNKNIKSTGATSSLDIAEQTTTSDITTDETDTANKETETISENDETSSQNNEEEAIATPNQQTTTIQEKTTPKQETTKKEEIVNKEEQTSTTSTNETEYKVYQISKQSYDGVWGKVGDWYVVCSGGKYGVVTFDGIVKLDIKYDSCKKVGEHEIEFVLDDMAYVFDKSLNKILQYKQKEVIENRESYVMEFQYENQKHRMQLYSSYAWCQDDDADKNSYITRTYYNGMMIEEKKFISMQDYEVQVNEYIITNKKTNKIIYSGYGTVYNWIADSESGGLYVSYFSDDDIILFSEDTINNKMYVYIINQNGATKKELDNIYDFSTGDFYNKGWFKTLWSYQKSLNLSTMEWVQLSSYHGSSWYYGRGEWYAVQPSNETESYDLIKGNTVMHSGFDWVDFSNEKYIRAYKNGKCYFINYNGKIVSEYISCSGISDGKILVYDGIGLYYVNDSFKKISEYIYSGEYDTFATTYIKIGGKYYLIDEK